MTASRIQVGASQDFLNTNKVTTSAGEVHNEIVELYSFQSTANTSTDPLGSSETYTGTFERNDQPQVMSSCQTDAAGTLYFDFSVDGTNYSTFPVAGFAVAAGIHEFHIAVKGPRYFRVRFVNGSDAQSYLRLYTYYGTFGAANTPLNQSIGLDSDGSSTRPTDYQDEVRLGRRSGVEGWNKFGYRTGISAASGEVTIWAASGNFTPLTSASTFTITYDGTGGGSTDGAGTTGATQLYFYYIDSSGLPAISAHTLGTDGSDVTSFSGLGINRCVVAANGGLTYNASTITVTATTGGTTQAVIPATESVTQQCIFFTGSNHTAMPPWLHATVKTSAKATVITINGYVYNRQFNTRYLIFTAPIDTSVGLELDISDPIKFKLNPTDVLYFTATSEGGGQNTADVFLRFSLNQYQLT